MNKSVRIFTGLGIGLILLQPGSAPAVPVTNEMVTVGNAGNAADTTGLPNPCGVVADKYRIGAYEVTAGQYTEFLNSVAATDTHALYSIFMFVDAAGCKIQRSGSSGNYTYSVPSDYADRPVNNVSWGDAARFVNWLHNGQPTGAQDASTTEDGSYTLNGAITDAELAAVTRNAGATWWIPTENEWYKAAYHKNDGVTGNYWDYPTGTDSDPGRDLTEITNPGNNANYHAASPYPIDGAYYATEKGEFELSDSPYGTFDQGGNVWEWTEASNPSVRVRRGSGFGTSTISDMSVVKRVESPPLLQQNDMGFRVAAPLPPPPGNPGAMALVTVGNPGNAADNTTYGAVAYEYRIGAYEVTAGQYTEFLNAVAATDTYDVYSTSMDTNNSPHGCNIVRSGASGSYSYTVAIDYAERPVNHVSWGDAARFANWYHNGRPSGAQDASTTEDGSYLLNGATSDVDLAAVTREADATWRIPSEDEWYKAAYHKNDGVTGNYWTYATGSDTDPGNDLTEATSTGNNANIALGPVPIESGTYYTTVKGEFELSESPYGTFDQTGNVYEWNEAQSRRGQGFGGGAFNGSADQRFPSAPSLQQSDIGFRLAAPPPPSIGTSITIW
jgi:formylglycine-generating enzyme required for sulfatase activity